MRKHCPDCHVPDGAPHIPGCDREHCPFCGDQLITCDCKYAKLGLINRDLYTADTDWLPPHIYNEGLSLEQRAQWEAILAKQGYIPYRG